MKRLQLRKWNTVFSGNTIMNGRDEALKFLNDIVDSSNTASTVFGSSLYAEPMVVKYLDEDGKKQVILAIGVENGLEPYHIIDSAKIEKDILANHNDIIANSGQIGTLIENEVHLSRIDESEYDANVKDEYTLRNTKGEEISGDRIKVYKDNSLVDAQLGYKGATEVVYDETTKKYVLHYDSKGESQEGDSLYLIYRNGEGVLSLVEIDFERFLMEAEFKDGLVVSDNHEVSVKIDSDSEKYLTVSVNGVKISGLDEKFDSIGNVVSGVSAYTIANHIESKDVVLTSAETGTTLEIQVDGKTISKELKYENGISVLSSVITLKEVEPSDISIKKSYELQNKDGEKIGDRIEISKESSLSDVGIGKVGDEINPATGEYVKRGEGNDTLNFIYLTTKGTYELISVEISKYFTDAHFGKGLSNHDGVISLQEGDGNEYLVIGEDTIAVIGVNDKIAEAKKEVIDYTDSKISALTSSLSSITENLKDRVAAVESGLTAEETARINADSALTTAIANEKELRINSESAITSNLDNEISERKEVDTQLQNEIKAEHESIVKLNASIDTISGTLNTNIESIYGELSTLSARIDTSKSEIESEIVSGDTKLLNEISILSARIDTNKSEIEAEIASATTKALSEISILSARIDTNKSELEAEILSGDTKLLNEISILSARINTNKSEIEAEIASATTKALNEISILSARIDTNKSEIESEIVSGGTKLLNEITSVSGKLENEIVSANTHFESEIAEINNEKVIDVDYNSDSKIIRLKKANGEYTEGFDASRFLVDGVLTSVSLEGNNLVFIWNDDEKTKISVSLSSFVDTYKSTNDFIKVENYEITAIVDNANGLSNTLASTDFAKSAASSAMTELSGNVSTTFSSVTKDFQDKINDISGVVSTELSSVTKECQDSIEDLRDELKLAVSGVVYQSSLITDGLPTTDIPVEEAEQHSLLREIVIGGKSSYYVTNLADRMLFVNADGTTTNLNEKIKNVESEITEAEERLNQKITNLEAGINSAITQAVDALDAKLQAQIAEVTTKLSDNVKSIINGYLIGTDKEISVTNTGTNLKVGFADNAIFGED